MNENAASVNGRPQAAAAGCLAGRPMLRLAKSTPRKIRSPFPNFRPFEGENTPADPWFTLL